MIPEKLSQGLRMNRNNQTKIKICGMTSLEDALIAADYGADALGFVFASSQRRILPQRAKEIIENLPPFVLTVGVFMNQSLDEVEEIRKFVCLDIVQLHGEEVSEYCNQISGRVVKCMRVSGDDTGETLLLRMRNYNVSAFILDPGAGSGKSFNWKIIKEIDAPLIIAGGLTPENVGFLIKEYDPYGVDVSSGVEFFCGKKDRGKIKKFIEEIRCI